MTPRDSISLTARYRRLRFPDQTATEQTLTGSDGYSLSVGYGHGVTERVSLFAGVSASLGRFDSGSKARTVSASGGLDYQVRRCTRLRLRGGVLWLQETQEADGVAFVNALGSPGYVASARLSHTLDRISIGLLAERDVGFTTGLGRPTIRDRATASIGTQTPRWNPIAHFGFARNHPLSTAGASPGFSSSDAIDTWTTCAGAGVRVASGVSVVGMALYAHQLNGVASQASGVDTYRVALGIRLPHMACR